MDDKDLSFHWVVQNLLRSTERQMISNMGVPMKQFPAVVNTSSPDTLMPHGWPCRSFRWTTKIYFLFWEADLIRKSRYDFQILFTQNVYRKKYFPNEKFTNWEYMLAGYA